MLETIDNLATPVIFGSLIALATIMVWMAFRPAPPAQQVAERLDDYLDRADIIEEGEMSRPFAQRALLPPVHGVLRTFGRFWPTRSLASIQQLLVRAGNPGGLTPLDFTGLRLLLAIVLGTGTFFLLNGRLNVLLTVLGTVWMAVFGYLAPMLWLQHKARRRQYEIQRALPDALDMMTIGVEAGLAFESAMVRVGDLWDNALTQEFRRAVAEMRVGLPRNEALMRIAERTGVPDLRTFVAVLVQSTQMGVSIADVLHSQADQMRIKRRQRAEELARQASIKMVFPLVFLIFPAMFVVILGPGVPQLVEFFQQLQSG